MMISGQNLIGFTYSGDSNVLFRRSLMLEGLERTYTFHEASGNEIDQAVKKGASAFHLYRLYTGPQKAAFLESIAAAIDEEKEELIAIAAQETHLSETRLRGEIQRTINQARHFA